MKYHKNKFKLLNKKNMEEQECVKDAQYLNLIELITVDNAISVY